MSAPVHAYLVANARYHDTDFARLELLKLLAEDEDIRTRVADSFRAGGEVLYITLGHCCGKYDMRPAQEIAEVVRGSWENPVYLELLRRALRWARKAL